MHLLNEVCGVLRQLFKGRFLLRSLCEHSVHISDHFPHAWAKRLGPIHHEQKTVPPCRLRQNRPQLPPAQVSPMPGPKILGNLQFPGRIPHRERLHRGFVEDGF